MVRHLSLELYHNDESLESARAETVALQSEEVYASVEEMLVSLVESNVCRGCGALLGTDAEEEGEVAMACGEEEEEGACFRGGMPSLWSYEELRWVRECEETGDCFGSISSDSVPGFALYFS